MWCMQAWEASIVAAGYQGRDSAANGMVLITVLLCTLVRGAKLQEAKVSTAAMQQLPLALCVPALSDPLLRYLVLPVPEQNFVFRADTGSGTAEQGCGAVR
jgi:hypothetical protein